MGQFGLDVLAPCAGSILLGIAEPPGCSGVVCCGRARATAPGLVHESYAFCLGVTSSNWIAGMLVAGIRHHWRRALQIVSNSLSVVVVLWAIQYALFPTADFLIGYAHLSRFILPDAAGGPGQAARALLFHSVVMPALQLVEEPKWGPIMSVQRSTLGSSGTFGIVATVLWAVMLVFAARDSGGRTPTGACVSHWVSCLPDR